jgi:hypothetical protein
VLRATDSQKKSMSPKDADYALIYKRDPMFSSVLFATRLAALLSGGRQPPKFLSEAAEVRQPHQGTHLPPGVIAPSGAILAFKSSAGLRVLGAAQLLKHSRYTL